MTRGRWLLAAAVIAALAAGAWFLPEEARYKLPAELENRPYPLRRIDFEPPQGPAGIEYFGRLRMDLYIGRDGRVDRIEVLESTLPPAFVEHARAAVSAVGWEPGTRNGRRVRSVKRIEVDIPPPAGLARPPMRPEQ